MCIMPTKYSTELELKKLSDKTDYVCVNNMTDEDAKAPTDEELKKFKKVKKNGYTAARQNQMERSYRPV